VCVFVVCSVQVCILIEGRVLPVVVGSGCVVYVNICVCVCWTLASCVCT